MQLDNEERYSSILKLQEDLNLELRRFYEQHKDRGREFLAKSLIQKVEDLIEELNKTGFEFGRCNYGGSIDYENSEQTFSSGLSMGTGIVLHFHGYSVQASWSDA